MSGAAPVLAYLFDLPIYDKGGGLRPIPKAIAEDFERWQFDRVPGAWERFLAKNGVSSPNELRVRPRADLTSYEYGGRKELIGRYLL